MSHIGETAIRFPVSGSGAGIESVHLRFVRQRNSASLSVIAGNANPVLAVPSNLNRVNLLLLNDSPSICYIRYGSGSLDSNNYSLFISPVDRTGTGAKNASAGVVDLEGAFTGPIYARWESATGSLKVTEFFNV